MLGACDRFTTDARTLAVVKSAEGSDAPRAQRLLIDRQGAGAGVRARRHLAGLPRPNGSIDLQDPPYLALKKTGFADYRLVIDGLVERPLSLSLADLRAQTARTQITRHDCVEGWSSIAMGPSRSACWFNCGGPEAAGPLRRVPLLRHPGRADGHGRGRYYESNDLIDAYHPQTILAYAMNDRALPVAHGAPLRLRVERQLGYKQAKYIMRIEAVADYAHLHQGCFGGFWEDRGYEWYAGI